MLSIILVAIIGIAYSASAQTLAQSQVLVVNAVAEQDGSISLKWDETDFSGNYHVYRRVAMDIEDWDFEPIAILDGATKMYKDVSAKKGEEYEYQIIKAQGTQAISIGYVNAGNEKKEIPNFGGLILVVDSVLSQPLSAEITRLENDIKSDGWTIKKIMAGRSQTPPQVKAAIQKAYLSMKNPQALLLLGHIPVPYSGAFSSQGTAPPPDGHVEGSGNHTGAWPADVFYGEFDGFWTDVSVNIVTGAQTRHHNVPSDGKYDQSKIPDNVDVEIGRIDMFDMPAFGKSEIELMKIHLDRNHAWRNGKLSPVRRALVDNNFTGLNLASTGYHNFSTMVHRDSIFSNRDYMASQKRGSYLWSYGCGGGSYSSCAGIGSTNDFVNDSLDIYFTVLAGSFFGDWDSRNNFLRAPLATGALASFWGGIPKWYVHHMAMGRNIGYGARLSQNNTSFYFNGNFNFSQNSVHIALMGDPTLRLYYPVPPSNLQANSSDGDVVLQWQGTTPAPASGYAVYRVDTVSGVFTRLNAETVPTASYRIENLKSGTYTFAVRALELDHNASGSYFAPSNAVFATLRHTVVGAEEENEIVSETIEASPNPSSRIFTIALPRKPIGSDMLRIVNARGNVVQEIRSEDIATNVVDIDLSFAPTGAYTLQYIFGEKVLVKKLIKLP